MNAYFKASWTPESFTLHPTPLWIAELVEVYAQSSRVDVTVRHIAETRLTVAPPSNVVPQFWEVAMGRAELHISDGSLKHSKIRLAHILSGMAKFVESKPYELGGLYDCEGEAVEQLFRVILGEEL